MKCLKKEKLPIRYFDTHTHGDIMSTYTNDVDTLEQRFHKDYHKLHHHL